jgi:hypothetical protein
MIGRPLCASGEFCKIKDESHGLKPGTLSHCMTLGWIAVGWQMAYLGALGLTFLVSPLFSNVIKTMRLPFVCILGFYLQR